MKLIWMTAGAALLVAGCTSTEPDGPPPPPAADAAAGAPGMPTTAPGYLAMAASSDMYEIQAGQLALQRSQDPAIRQFAQMIVSDHTRSTSELMGAANSAGVTPPPPQMMPRHADMLAQLQGAGPDSFAATFRDQQIMAHQEALALHQTYAAQGDVPALRTVAGNLVPVIQGHLGMAQSLPATASAPMPPPPAPSSPSRAGERG